MHSNYFELNLVENLFEEKDKKQVGDRNEWLKWREKINL